MNKQELNKKINELKIIGFDSMDQLQASRQRVAMLEKQYNQVIGEIVRFDKELKDLGMKKPNS